MSISLFLSCALAASFGDTRAPATTALVGATLFLAPDQDPVEDGVVLVRDGRIVAAGSRGAVAVPEEAVRVECGGGALTAGFWNCHVHFTDPRFVNAAERAPAELEQALGEMLTRHGFVHVLDTGSDLANTVALRARIEGGELRGPRVLTAGLPFVPAEGTPFYVAPMRLPELASAEDALAGVRARLDGGADAVKLFVASPVTPERTVVLPPALVRAVVEATHARKKLVLAHPTSLAGVEAALEGGVDVLLHTTPDGGEDWSPALIARMRDAGIALAPTLKLWTWELERKESDPALVDRFLELACRQLGAFAAAGGPVLFGTDVGYMDDDDPREEFLLMHQAGLDWRAILGALTTAPAARLGGDPNGGRITAGAPADLVLLAARPDRDVAAFASVRACWRAGERLPPRD